MTAWSSSEQGVFSIGYVVIEDKDEKEVGEDEEYLD